MKSMYIYRQFLRSPLVIFSVLSLTLHGVYCVCDSNNAVEYVPIPPENYDRNYSSISNVNAHPLGFNQSIWYYENAGHPNPCFRLTGAAKRRIEIMFETFPPSRLCVTVEGSDNGMCSESGTGRLYRCIASPGNDVYIELSCDSQCSEDDVRFWYRFVLGESAENDPEDHWCDGRNQDEYPENLLQLPPNYPIDFGTTTPADKSPSLSISILALLIVTCLHILF